MSIDAERGSLPWTDRDGLGSGPISVSGYTSPDYYQSEIERLWKKTWLDVGRVHQLANPGDYFVKDLPALNASILVARAKDGSIRAFHNICTHRCNRVVQQDRGNAKAFTCNFHGWSYRLDGTLAVITDESNFFDIDKADYGLAPVHVDTWEDFVFINLATEPAETLTEYLGDLVTGMSGYPFEEFTHEIAWAGDLQCNWKLIQDAFLEAYHVGTLHPQSAGPANASPQNPYAHPPHFGFTKYHSTSSVVANLGYLPPPMQMMAMTTGVASVADGIRLAGNSVSPPMMNPAGAPEWQAELFAIFPSTILICLSDFFLHFNCRPLAVDRCRFEIKQCVRPPRNASERWAHEVSAGSLYATVLEDISTVERIQSNMASGVRKAMVLQDYEVQIRNTHHWCQQFAGAYPEV